MSDERAGLSRRQFLGGAAALAAGLALPAWPGITDAADAAGDEAGRGGAELPSHRPNIVILMTDQERYPQHWPEGWARENLPNRQRLARHGLTFRRAFCAAAMCSPSRASIFTGLYPAEHGVTEVLQYGTKADETRQRHAAPEPAEHRRSCSSPPATTCSTAASGTSARTRAARSPSRAGATSSATTSRAG